jgi:hypothetical protein
MTLLQIIEAIWRGQGSVVETFGNDFAGLATVNGRTVAEWDNGKPDECWLIKPDGSVVDIWQLTSEGGGVPSEGPAVCPAAG